MVRTLYNQPLPSSLRCRQTVLLFSPSALVYTKNSMIFWTCSVRQVLYLTPTFVSLTVSTNRLDEGLRLCLETLDNLDTNINLISTQVSIIRGPKKALPVDPGHPVDNFISRLVSSLYSKDLHMVQMVHDNQMFTSISYYGVFSSLHT